MFMLYYFGREGANIRLTKQKYDVNCWLTLVVRIEFFCRSNLWVHPWSYERTAKREMLGLFDQRLEHNYRAMQAYVLMWGVRQAAHSVQHGGLSDMQEGLQYDDCLYTSGVIIYLCFFMLSIVGGGGQGFGFRGEDWWLGVFDLLHWQFLYES